MHPPAGESPADSGFGEAAMRRAAIARATIVWATALVLLGMASSAAAQPELRAWVEMTAAGAQARVATSDGRCPSLTIDGRRAAMDLRAPADADFPLTVCQAALPNGPHDVALEGRPLPAPRGPPQRILIFGDTGCRLKGHETQDCNDPKAWPFREVVRHAAQRKPDLVIHVGDYYYRETPCPDGVKGCAGSPFGDKWITWKAEFFDPAQPLLASAPWVFVRGNHESCSRGGRGWFRQLDAADRPLACPTLSAPFAVDIGGLSLYVLDSAEAEDATATAGDVADIKAQLDALKLGTARRPGWILTHRPIWALTPVAGFWPLGPVEAPLNATEQAAVRGLDLSNIGMVVAGHVHHFAAYDFGGGRPSQVVAGSGGDIGADSDTARIRQGPVVLDGRNAQRLTFERYGYFLLDRAGADWVGGFWDLNDHVVAACRLHEQRLSCAPAPGAG
jgi:hypothetical protein